MSRSEEWAAHGDALHELIRLMGWACNTPGSPRDEAMEVL